MSDDDLEDADDEAILKCMGRDGKDCREIATCIYEHSWFCAACDPMNKKSNEPGPEWDDFLKE